MAPCFRCMGIIRASRVNKNLLLNIVTAFSLYIDGVFTWDSDMLVAEHLSYVFNVASLTLGLHKFFLK